MRKLTLIKDIYNGTKSYSILGELSVKLEEYKGTVVIIDLAEVSFIAANHFAVLGALFSDFMKTSGSKIHMWNISARIRTVMRKNGFGGRWLGMKSAIDIHNTCIPYKSFKRTEISEFEKYLLMNVFGRDDFPDMNDSVRYDMMDNILEVFNNVKEHTTAEEVHVCGQFFPKTNMMYVSIVDIGETIKENVANYLDKLDEVYSSHIGWAIEEGNSTRKSGTPGGLGFKFLSDCIKDNKGILCIVSDDECYEFVRNKKKFMKYNFKFKGTIVTVGFNMENTQSYLEDSVESEMICL